MGQAIPPPAGGEPDIVFLDGLASSGLLQREPDVHGANDILIYMYKVIPGPDVKVLYGGTQSEDALFTLARSAVNEVSGVSQEGNDAVVEAQVGWDPSELYKRASPNVKAALAKCASIQGVGPYSVKPYYCSHWPSESDMSATKTVTFQFKKFDDGWRVVE